MHSYKLNFNQDFTSISASGSTGYRIFTLSSMEKIEEISCKGSQNIPDIRILERLFNSNLVVLVTESNPNCLKILNFRKKEDSRNICDCVYPTRILSVRMNRRRLIVCLEQSIHIHDIQDMKLLHSIDSTAPNELGLCALSWNYHLAYPASCISGEIQIYDTEKLLPGLCIKAHETPLSAMNFSPNGVLIATASERGTVIRVFCVKNGQRVHEFRRGVKRCVRIASLVFSQNGDYICTSSNTETVHIFKIDSKTVENAEMKGIANNCEIGNDGGPQSSSSLEDINDTQKSDEDYVSWSVGYLAKAVTSYLPSQMYDVFSQDRAFATAQLNQPGLKHICALAKLQKEMKLFVACEDGFLYIYDFNDTKGGNCKLMRAHDLRNPLEGVIALDLNECKDNNKAAQHVLVVDGQNSPDISYAGVLKGSRNNKMTESEKCRSIGEALETPMKTIFDERQFPPVTSVRE